MLFDRVRRMAVAQHEVDRIALRYLTHNDQVPMKSRMAAQFALTEMPARASANRIMRRCTMTGRHRSVVREFNINRIQFKALAEQGHLPGVTKSCW